MKKQLRATALVAVLVPALTMGLTSCGKATVSAGDPEVSATVAPLPRDTVTAITTTPGASGSDAGDAAAAATGAGAAKGQDLSGREISALPETTPESPEEVLYLEALRKGGIDTTGVVDQLVGTAHAVCADPNGGQQLNVTALAIAGQLLAQDKTKLSAEEAAKLIDSSARKAYC
ncbi:DUF732 domain-containing protein [Corynebacterium caspium]|uniref:DUF732 domain-containing protein n=1 Tax=Corynebacterium caspium TaxID=234828 RepID=UPI00035D3107|nr:DUF732 domain-containing protein [Corynebacterium caspium]WKD59982.1 hypothetical protein CCASP_08035 [Corynebacterium caspium DSM 44850]